VKGLQASAGKIPRRKFFCRKHECVTRHNFPAIKISENKKGEEKAWRAALNGSTAP
jgi:hypothetical protein